jgi:hypothetical protein
VKSSKFPQNLARVEVTTGNKRLLPWEALGNQGLSPLEEEEVTSNK